MSVTVENLHPGEELPAKARIRLDYLDGIRGVAALYVVLFHISQTGWFFVENGKWNGVFALALEKIIKIAFLGFFAYGHYAVDVFIVLSGYVLMLPVIRNPEGKLTGGMLTYIKRRAWRILPPYYVALILSLVLLALVPSSLILHNGFYDDGLPAFTQGVLLSHLLMIHDFSPHWLHKINGPMWSVAVEWQIYFAYQSCYCLFGGASVLPLQ